MFTDYIVNLEYINSVLTFFMIRLLSICFLLVSTVVLLGQSSAYTPDDELESIATDYQLSEAQIAQAEQLILKRNKDLKSLSTNSALDEPHRIQKRSSIIKGFKGSIKLLLSDDQISLFKQKVLNQRKERIAAIEDLKEKGYSQSEIIKLLDNKIKVTSIHE